jgi:hypothetical protein
MISMGIGNAGLRSHGADIVTLYALRYHLRCKNSHTAHSKC